MLKGAIYCRVSTEDQETNGMSLPYQQETCLKFAWANSLNVPKELIFVEQYSGGFLERPELDKLRLFASKKLLDFVIFAKRDRVARDQYVFQKIMKDFADAGVQVFYAEEKLTGDIAMDDFMGSTIIGFASWEKEQIRKRCHAWKIQHARQNKWPFSTVPFGYIKNPKTKELELYEPEKNIILRMVHMYVYENATLWVIAKTFTKEGILPPSMSDKGDSHQEGMRKLRKNAVNHWSETTVHRVLVRAPTFSGKYHAFQKIYKKIWNKSIVLGERPKEDWIAIKIPQIITEKEAWVVMEKLESNRRYSKKRSVRSYMLQGKLFCDCETCMRNFTGYYHNQKELRNYRCNNYNLRWVSEERHCKNHVSGIKIESIVMETLKELFLDTDFLWERALDEILPETVEVGSTRDRYMELYGLLQEIEAKDKRNEELFIDGIISKERLLQHKETLKVKQEEYEKELRHEYALLRKIDNKESVTKTWKEAMVQIREETETFFEKADYLQMKELVNLVVDRVIIPVNRKNAVRIVIKMPFPPEVMDKYSEEDICTYTDEHGVTHNIVPMGEFVPKALSLDPTKKPFTSRMVEFLGDKGGGDFPELEEDSPLIRFIKAWHHQLHKSYHLKIKTLIRKNGGFVFLTN